MENVLLISARTLKNHQDMEKEVEVKKSSERLRLKNLKELSINNKVAEKGIKKKRGRPRKIIKSNFILTILNFLFLIGLVFADLKSPIQGNFNYCDQGQGNLLNTENTCVTLPETSVFKFSI